MFRVRFGQFSKKLGQRFKLIFELPEEFREKIFKLIFKAHGEFLKGSE